MPVRPQTADATRVSNSQEEEMNYRQNIAVVASALVAITAVTPAFAAPSRHNRPQVIHNVYSAGGVEASGIGQNGSYQGDHGD
jgi:hypothetical protein